MATTTETEQTVTVTVGENDISFSTGRLAKQADGAVLVSSGETRVLATAVGRTEAREGIDFFPLTVDIEEKMYAAGKIPGGFFKREGKASERATLNARMVDRPIRPLWPKGFRNEVQIIGTVLSADFVAAHDVLAINGASAALMLSPLPFLGPVAAVRVGLIEGELVLNPTLPEMETSSLDLIVCGSPDAITMVEAGAKQIAEDVILEALGDGPRGHQAHLRRAGRAAVEGRQAEVVRRRRQGRPRVALQLAARRRAPVERPGRHQRRRRGHGRRRAPGGRRRRGRGRHGAPQPRAHGARASSPTSAAPRPSRASSPSSSATRSARCPTPSRTPRSSSRRSAPALVEAVLHGIKLPFPGGAADGGLDAPTAGAVKAAVDSVYKQIVRTKIAVDKRRPDGRSETEIRAITCDVGLIPRAHGSALFTRGQTQALTLATLGTVKEEQRIDDLSLQTTKRYIHHYNFPPFSVGETGFMRGPKRRDIGHGALAERAILAVVPETDEFPYTMRLVSEILESNGSSSMASVCGSSLALFDAGVGIKSAVAGIAMGLIKEGDDLVILTDIQGAEDHLGDMDFKVAGTPDGITALQMDIKITGVTQDTMRAALAQAKDARLRILEVMNATISEPRSEMAAHAPQVLQTQISPDQIGLLIGKGGETIRGIQEEFTVQIDVEEDGSVRIYGAGDSASSAREHIDQMMRPMQVGDVLRERKVVKVSDFGAFVELRKGTDGLLHVSRVTPGVRIATMEQILERGAMVDVEVVEVDSDRGRIALKLVGLHEDGNLLTPQDVGERYKLAYPEGERSERPPREDGDRGDRRPRGRGGRDRGPRS